ncbi:hypothetical protein [Flavobacterium sp. H122]|uniref:hypothetical protein n=1 Tax=Flavobacterium sp. H122 TaxID=2529860 RepID=UPI0010AAB94D|nr:hypothetical protein [Flavobacterium sp. H122]
MNKIILIGCFLVTQFMMGQVSHITKNILSYTKDVFPYQGTRIISIDEVHSPDKEENVYIFSKIEANKQPDSLYFQHYKNKSGNWKKIKSISFSHDGFLSIWKSRKAFMDSDKNKSIDALFIFSKHNKDKEQESVHLLLCSNEELYFISAKKEDNYQEFTYSDNFKNLKESIKSDVIKYWNELDKK